jgi:two-component system sensor histidine kinase AlgZ
MPKVHSINQNIAPQRLPNFRNLGTVLRIILLVNGIALMGAVTHAITFADLQNNLLQGSAFLQPVLMTSLLLLYAINPVLTRAPYRQGVLIVVAAGVVTTLMIDALGGGLFADAGDNVVYRCTRHVVVSVAVSLIMLMYFHMRTQALSPAKQEARLQALQARIRPHFLFNTINAVLSIVRADPKRAETALEDMADLFRMAMTEPRELVELSKEVALAHQYLAIETLRLGERLKVNWDTQNMPPDALIPPLILQPLLENAVYHGIEPLSEGGTIEIKLYLQGSELHLEVRNPAPNTAESPVAGNRMALENIRERLDLRFDVEAQYRVERDENHYHVHILIPYVKEPSA